MPRKKRPEALPFTPASFAFSRGAKGRLDKYLLSIKADAWRAQLGADCLAKVLRVENTPEAIQAEGLRRLEIEAGFCLGALSSDNASLERGKRARPFVDARRRLFQTARNVFWLFDPVPQETKATKSEGAKGSAPLRRPSSPRERKWNDFFGIILYDMERYATRSMNFTSFKAPLRRQHGFDLRDWAPKPRGKTDARIDARRSIIAKADSKALNRNARSPWKMPPRVRRIPLPVRRVLPYVRRRQPVVRRTSPVVGRALIARTRHGAARNSLFDNAED